MGFQVSYCSMMDAYAKADMIKEAHETFDEMIAKGFKPGNDISDPLFKQVMPAVSLSNLSSVFWR